MADGKIEKIIEFQAKKAVNQLDQVINRLTKTHYALDKLEKQAKQISFEKFIPAINEFANSFAKLKIEPQNITNIQSMAQALNRYKMTAVELSKKNAKVDFSKITQGIYGFSNSVKRINLSSDSVVKVENLAQALNRFKMVSLELNKKDFNVSYEKMTRAIYGFTDSISRMNLLANTITQISSLGLAMNRLVNTAVKLQNIKVSFSSLTQAIYAFVGSILRIKDLDSVIVKLERLANAMEKLRINSKRFTVIRDFTEFEKAKAKIGKLEDKMKLLKGTLNQLNNVGKNTNGIFANIRSLFDSIRLSASNVSSQLADIRRLLNLSWLRSIYNMGKRIGEMIYNLVKAYSGYIENINLATVAYGGLEEAASKLYPFVEKISNAFGLNESEVIRSVGLFKQMANAMGLAQEQGDLLATSLTKMAYDISSLYNISFERAMSALQSSLVGQTKPIRGATGADITENTLRKTMKDLGLKQEIRDLSYVEKRLVMVISLTKQLANAEADLARTMCKHSCLKILKKQEKRLGYDKNMAYNSSEVITCIIFTKLKIKKQVNAM